LLALIDQPLDCKQTRWTAVTRLECQKNDAGKLSAVFNRSVNFGNNCGVLVQKM
jgi:hypothetical protein